MKIRKRKMVVRKFQNITLLLWKKEGNRNQIEKNKNAPSRINVNGAIRLNPNLSIENLDIKSMLSG
jgi:hypothetical protein